MNETRKIAAILAADVVGYGRLAGADEDRTLARLRGLRSDLIDPSIDAHHGRIVKRTGAAAINRMAIICGPPRPPFKTSLGPTRPETHNFTRFSTKSHLLVRLP
jgi:class 3 adenylate cyclase